MEAFERLYFIRKKIGESQEVFAKNLGIQRGSYSDVERGRVKTFSESMLLLLRINYGVNPDWVQYGEGEAFLVNDRAKAPVEEYETVKSLKEKIAEKEELIKEQEKRIAHLEAIIKKVKKVIE